MTVYLWNQGKIENVSYSPISSKFYYCSKSPFANIVYSDEANVPPAVSGKDRIEQSWPHFYKARGLNMGPIQTDWEHAGRLNRDSVYIRVRTKPVKRVHGKEEGALEYEYALLEESDLNNIKDPSQYQYGYLPPFSSKDVTLISKNHISIPSNKVPLYKGCVEVFLNKTIILKSGNVYAAIKPIKLDLKFTREVINNEEVKTFDPREQWMTYEWKFWSEVIPPKEIAGIDPAIIK